jgi:hypothetical protein
MPIFDPAIFDPAIFDTEPSTSASLGVVFDLGGEAASQPVPFTETTWGGGTLTGNGQYEFSSAVTNFYLHVVVVNQG